MDPTTPRGLREDGTIDREGALDRVSPAFRAVVDAARELIVSVFGATRLHSAYLYGSVPRGTAVPGHSDLDVLLALRHAPDAADRADADHVATVLDREFAQIDGAALNLAEAAELLSERERHDGGFFVACLCTPLLGDDLAEHLPQYRPTSLLARETNGDLARLLPQWQARLARPDTDREALARSVGRRLVRTGFTLVMPRWGGWTSDLDEAAAITGRYYPARAGQLRLAAATGVHSTAHDDTLRVLIEDLGPWLAAEYRAWHGEKTARG
ncbi:nucleotidyltransferase domain-containing protein [Saccharomonospora piscinae]|uniref:nucleotidyltransferase domain-containing protein n=1 Tax=Saccharomonospora piscinae TaxID=687388 RepID=UPI0011062FAA|nr:nucleotidyltransferase domain-containing protein [Saccharomonospora piscinae]TLW92390.1 nucleotidyltransferase domain-containing protein [Saccharomonospora piscinae]